MHTILKKRLCLLLLAACWGCASTAQAQFITTSSTNPYTSPTDFEFRTDGTMMAKGLFNTGSLATGDQSAGTRMLWFAGAAAFRAGNVSGSQWNASNLGSYSVAFGSSCTASGAYSAAFGSGDAATGAYSSAFGALNTAIGSYSTAFGGGNSAHGNYSVAWGHDTAANGDYSVAFGFYTKADAFASTACGRYNKGGGSNTTWVSSDPLFEVGNGTGTPDASRANAMTIYKDGTASFPGVVNIAPASNNIPVFTNY